MKLFLEHIGKGYGGKTVLGDCSFAFDAPGVYVLMGPNGSGKSTLLRICSLLEPPDAGSVSYCDGDFLLKPDLNLRRKITLVLPLIGVFNTTVFANVSYGLMVRGARKGLAEERVRKSLAFVGLEHLARQHALTLSSGETQRMAIARALAIEPEILFLDEPTASVDGENTQIIESIIRELRREGRTTVIMTTHDRDQAGRLADRLLTLRGGAILA